MYAPRALSPELVLVDPNLSRTARGHASGHDGPMTPEEQMSGETIYVNGTNGAAPAAAAAPNPAESTAPPSLETILFKAGLITADQLGEVVLERVQSGRSAGEIVVERGLVSREVLAGLLAAQAAAEAAHAPAVEPEPVAEPVAAPAPVGFAAPPLLAPSVAEPEPIAAPEPAPAFEQIPAPEPTPAFEHIPAPIPTPAPEPAPFVPPAPEPVAEVVVEEPVAPPMPAQPEPVVAPEPETVAEALPQQQPQPEPQPETAPAVAPEDRGFSMGEVQYGVRIRLAEGVTLDAGSFPGREAAVEAARGIANKLAAEGGEWPLVGDTFVRPDAVLAIEVESAVAWFSSREQ